MAFVETWKWAASVEKSRLDAEQSASEAAASAQSASLSATEAEDSASSVASDAEQTALDVISTNEDAVQTALDRIATAADRVQTGLDAAATAQDVIDAEAAAQLAITGIYASEIVTAPTTGTLTLKLNKETYIGTVTNANVFTVALPAPIAGLIAESILIFKVGASLPTITQPSGIAWRGATPTLAINKSYTICYEQVNTTGTTYEIWAVAVANV